MATTQTRKKAKTQSAKPVSGSLLTELVQINTALAKAGLDLPKRLTKAVFQDSGLEPTWHSERLYDLVGEMLLSTFDHLGPVYGKAMQVTLSRLSPGLRYWAGKFRLNRVYGDWPAMPFSEVESILDQEIPSWHTKLKVNPYPIGVASMAQVHSAEDDDGREWVIKVIKPQSAKRLNETVGAMEQIIAVLQPITLSRVGRRTLRELTELCTALRMETALDREKKNIDRIREKLKNRKQQLLRIPETLDEFSTPHVLTVERFHGVSMVDIVDGHAAVPEEVRKKLARKMLAELLVQVFEVGLFHGDPHAGNLIFMEDGTIGLFDWGLAGELTESDRRHIASILKALLAVDMDKLVLALHTIAEEGGGNVEPEEISAALKKLADKIKEKKEQNQKLGLQELLDECLKAAEKLGIPIPDGLLLMAKSLLTIEGLARGIDPGISMARVATPVLLRAARPSIKDLFYMGKRMPVVARKMWESRTQKT